MDRSLIRAGLGGVAAKSAHLIFTLATAVILARAIGPDGYGIYAFSFALVQLLSIPAQLGFQVLVVREVARYHARREWAYLKGVVQIGAASITAISLLLSAVGLFISWYFVDNAVERTTLFAALLLLPLVALGNYFGAAVRGFRKVVQGQLPELVLRPGGLVLLLLAAWWFGSPSALTPGTAMFLHVGAGLFALLIAVVLLKRCLSNLSQAGALYDAKRWSKSALALSAIAGLQVINTQADVVLLRLLAEPRDVGLYKVAAQGASLVAFGLQVLNMTVAPYLSRLYELNERSRLQALFSVVAAISLLVALPVVITFIALGDFLLASVFGRPFESGHGTLVILAMAQLVNAAVGPVGLLLNMSGHEYIVARVIGVAAGINVGLNVALIPLLGIEGAAIATGVSIVVWNVMLARTVMGRLNLGLWIGAIFRRRDVPG